jgi:flagellar motor switch protein FliG
LESRGFAVLTDNMNIPEVFLTLKSKQFTHLSHHIPSKTALGKSRKGFGSMPKEDEDDYDDDDIMPARQKVAVLMIALGQETTAEVMKYLSDMEVEQIAQSISELDIVTTEQEDTVLEEFEQLLLAGKYVSQGGIDFARGALEKALGPRKAQEVLDRVTSTTSSGFYMLRNVDPNQIVPFISKEHPQTIALILSQLDPTQSAGVLNGLPEEMQSDVAIRIARMDNISPQILRELEESLANDLEAILSGQITEIGGPKAVAEILNHTGRSTEKAVLERLDAQDPELAEQVRNQMFVFDDIANLTDKEIQMVLREVDSKDLAVALKGGSDEIQKRILGNMSERVSTMLKEEMQFAAPVRMSDVEEVQLRIVQTVRQLEEAGQVTIVRGDTNDVFV